MSAIMSGLSGLSFEERLAQKERRLKHAAAAVDEAADNGAARGEWWPLAGLAPMTRVKTIFGDVHAVALRTGDEVLTARGEYKPILWLNRVMLDAQFLTQKPDSQPVCIRGGALGSNNPEYDIMVSPRQKVQFRGARWEEAAALVGQPGIERFRETGLSYTMFHLGSVEDVVVEGALIRTSPPAN